MTNHAADVVFEQVEAAGALYEQENFLFCHLLLSSLAKKKFHLDPKKIGQR